jgi:hypothetical protein
MQLGLSSFIGLRPTLRYVALMVMSSFVGSVDFANGGIMHGSTGHSVVCQGPEGRVFLGLSSPLQRGIEDVSESAFRRSVVHLTDPREFKALVNLGMIVDRGQPLGLRPKVLALISKDIGSPMVDDGRIRYIGGDFFEGRYLVGQTPRVRTLKKDDPWSAEDLSIDRFMQIDLSTRRLSDKSIEVQLQFSDYTPEIRRCTATQNIPNPWASLDPSIPSTFESCVAEEVLQLERVIPVRITKMHLTDCQPHRVN